MNNSNFLSLNWADFGKGLLMAVLTPVFVVVQQSLELGELTFNWKSIALSAIAGGVAYLVTVVGGGTVYAPVVWNGTNWVSH